MIRGMGSCDAMPDGIYFSPFVHNVSAGTFEEFWRVD